MFRYYYLLLLLVVLVTNGCTATEPTATPAITTSPTLDVNILTDTPDKNPTNIPINTQPYFSKNLGFSLMYPVDWEVNEDEYLVTFSSSTDELDPKNVTDAALWVGTTQIDTTMADMLEEFPSEVVVLREGSISIDSETWVSTQISFDNENLEGRAIATLCLTVKNDQGYMLVAVAPAEEWNTQQPIFQNMINTFKFEEVDFVDESSTEVSVDPEPTATAPEPTATTTPVPLSEASPSFRDVFNKPELNSQRWVPIPGAGQIDIDNDAVQLSSSGETFPVVYARENPFPVSGNFTVNVSMRYLSVTERGVGFRLGSTSADYGAHQNLERAELDEKHIIEIWQDSTNWHISVGENDTEVHILPAPDLNQHRIAINYIDGVYQVLLDDIEVYVSSPNADRPTVLWFGNPTQEDSAGVWSSLEISAISVGPLAEEQVVLRPTPTPSLPVLDTVSADGTCVALNDAITITSQIFHHSGFEEAITRYLNDGGSVDTLATSLASTGSAAEPILLQVASQDITTSDIPDILIAVTIPYGGGLGETHVLFFTCEAGRYEEQILFRRAGAGIRAEGLYEGGGAVVESLRDLNGNGVPDVVISVNWPGYKEYYLLEWDGEQFSSLIEYKNSLGDTIYWLEVYRGDVYIDDIDGDEVFEIIVTSHNLQTQTEETVTWQWDRGAYLYLPATVITTTAAQPAITPATPTPEPTATSAPEPAALERVGQIGGVSKAVVVQGHYAYLNVGPRLVILDIADSTHPTIVGQSPPLSGFESLIVVEDHAYVAGEGGLCVIDISDPTAPTEVGFYATMGPAWSITAVENTAYVATGDGLHILDISNPIVPTGIGFYDTPDAALDITVRRGIAYIAEAFTFSEDDNPIERGGLRVVDVSDPANPSEIGFYPMNPSQARELFDLRAAPKGARDVAVAGDYAYLTYRTWREGGLRVVDISDPANPSEIGNYQDYVYYISDVTVVGDPTEGSKPVYAYVATGVNFGLLVLDVSDPAQPTVLADKVPGAARGIAVAGNTLFVADEFGGLHIADISDPAHAFEVGFYNTLGDARGVVVAGNMAYVTDVLRDLWVVDLSDPTQPVQVGVYTAPGSIEDVAAVGTSVYIAAETAGLVVVDVSDPVHPVQASAYRTPGLAYGVAVTGDYAYIADGQLQVLNVSEPEQPILVAVYESLVRIEDVVVAEDTAYHTNNGLHILDISDPMQPAEVSFYATSGRSRDIAVVGAYAYLVVKDELHVVDISNWAHPLKLSSYDVEYARHMAVAGNYAYLVGEGRLHIVDVSNPTALKEIVSYDALRFAHDIAAVGDYVCVADGAGGLIILWLDDHRQ